jgi:lipopolysaccharide transport system ATP-binding protein
LKPILEIQNISKKFKIQHENQPYLSLRDSLTSVFKKKTSTSEEFYALKDVSFTVNPGESVGIIGRNGAGKSTLLKILSSITPPSSGRIITRGRIASLLEVGTGFHPELTGRENVFLNGSILGMRRQEILKNFDAIVDFAGVEKFIDTPLKHYSSGMQLRLAFAVAAFLENEILVIDEVLAVGDAEFQKKCMGKMEEVSKTDGRTVLFVSHNMASMRLLCSNCVFLKSGLIKNTGKTDEIISEYLSSEKILADASGLVPDFLSTYNTGEAKFTHVFLLNENHKIVTNIDFLEKYKVGLKLKIYKNIEKCVVSVFIVNQYGERIMMGVEDEHYKPRDFEQGTYYFEVEFNEQLMPGSYNLGFSINYFDSGNSIDFVDNFYSFKVNKSSSTENMEYPWNVIHGYIKPKTVWKIKKTD